MLVSFRNKKKNKKGMSLSILLLVFLTLILAGFSLFTFLSSQAKFDKKFQDFSPVRESYADEFMLNYYVQNILDNSVKSILTKDSLTKKVLISNMQNEIENKYKVKNPDLNNPDLNNPDLNNPDLNNPDNLDTTSEKIFIMPELSQVFDQINEDNLQINDKAVSFTVTIYIEKQTEGVVVRYDYTKTFESSTKKL